ncbi:MAG: dCTP deaminase [Minisyncoccota bacterium]
MAILTKQQILQRVAENSLSFTPALDEFQVQDHAVDLRLGFSFLVPRLWKITPQGRESLAIRSIEDHGPGEFDVVELEEGQYFDLLPQEHILVSTLEAVKIPTDLMSVLYPRSSINRKGLSVDLTGIIDSGYEGQLTLPIKNNTRSQTIRLYPGERFCQVVFEELTERVEPRKSRYHNRDIIDGTAKEKGVEVAFIVSGKIREMKTTHTIKIK